MNNQNNSCHRSKQHVFTLFSQYQKFWRSSAHIQVYFNLASQFYYYYYYYYYYLPSEWDSRTSLQFPSQTSNADCKGECHENFRILSISKTLADKNYVWNNLFTRLIWQGGFKFALNWMSFCLSLLWLFGSIASLLLKGLSLGWFFPCWAWQKCWSAGLQRWPQTAPQLPYLSNRKYYKCNIPNCIIDHTKLGNRICSEYSSSHPSFHGRC